MSKKKINLKTNIFTASNCVFKIRNNEQTKSTSKWVNALKKQYETKYNETIRSSVWTEATSCLQFGLLFSDNIIAAYIADADDVLRKTFQFCE